MSGFDWPAMLQVALRDMGLKPNEFWGLTPAEFLTMSGLGNRGYAMGRSDFSALMARFPDTPDGAAQ